MRPWKIAAAAGLAIVAVATFVMRPKPPPPVQAGRWETTAVRKVNGGTSEINRGLLCLKGTDATLERLVNPVEQRQDCKAGEQSQADGVFRKTWTCPGINGLPEERIEMEVHYRQDGYDGIAKLLSKSATGLTPSGNVALTGKRVGDC
jgi:hypothetical protein